MGLHAAMQKIMGSRQGPLWGICSDAAVLQQGQAREESYARKGRCSPALFPARGRFWLGVLERPPAEGGRRAISTR